MGQAEALCSFGLGAVAVLLLLGYMKHSDHGGVTDGQKETIIHSRARRLSHIVTGIQ